MSEQSELFGFDSPATYVIDGARARELDRAEKKKKKKGNSQASNLEESFAAEMIFWGLPAFVRQHRFHPTRLWRLDFAWPELKIGIEIHGGIFIPGGKGGHNRGAYMEDNYDKENRATLAGWSIYKFGPSQVRRKKRIGVSSAACDFMRIVFAKLEQSREK